MDTDSGTPIGPVSTSDHGMADEQCIFLDKLPAEMRSAIYELAFTLKNHKAIGLIIAHPPSNALLCTCRQVNEEAAKIYAEACQKYWEESDFTLLVPSNHPHRVLQAMHAATKERIASITSLRIQVVDSCDIAYNSRNKEYVMLPCRSWAAVEKDISYKVRWYMTFTENRRVPHATQMIMRDTIEEVEREADGDRRLGVFEQLERLTGARRYVHF